MIIPMTKYSLLIYHREYEDFLDKLRELGVVHIMEKETEITEEIRDKYQYIDRIDKAIRFLKKREQVPGSLAGELSGSDAYDEINRLQSQREDNLNRINNLRKAINELGPWGNFSPEKIDMLRKEGVNLRFFVSPSRTYDPDWKEQYTIEEINIQGGQVYFVAISHNGEEIDIPAEEVKLPSRSLASLKEERAVINSKLETIENRFDEIARNDLPALDLYKNSLLEDLEYEKVIHNTSREVEDHLMIIEGWVPQGSIEELNQFLNSSDVAYITSEPKEGDKVPVLLKNKSFAQKFEKIGELYSLPNYSEVDITPFFAPFYALFFGFCLGDIGYGILLAVGAIIARSKVQKEVKPIAVLVSYLGLATIFFGLISGVFFGINLYQTDLPGYQQISAMLAERDTDINMLLFYLALVLGAVQIIFGMVIKSVNETIQMGWKYAIGTYGWLTLVVGSLLVYLVSVATGITMETLRPVLYLVLIVSGVMILFLNNLNRNVFTNFGLGLWNSYNMATGLLGDLLSYIRLFALGISSAILGLVFNTMAVAMSGSIPVLSVIIMIIILVLGHSINLFMSGLGSFVHPLRLTFVEFYKNAGFAGGGRRYDPFRKIN